MVKIYNNTGTKGTRSVTSTGTSTLWSLDLSSIVENYLILEITTKVYDPLNNTPAVYHSRFGVYNDASASVPSYSTTIIDSDYSYDGGDSRLLKPIFDQPTTTLSQQVTILLSGARTITYNYSLKIIAFG